MNIVDNSDKKPDTDVVHGEEIVESKPFVDLFSKLNCQDCGTFLNGSTICPSCGKVKE